MTDTAEARETVERCVERATSPRAGVTAFAEATYRVGIDACGREFAERLFAGLAYRAASARRGGR